jgi:dTDP-4-dehydrorhamnose reductase
MSIYKKILFTGSSGRFGKVFKKINNSKKFIYPTSKQLNIINPLSVSKFFKKNKIDLVIHCAALSRPMNIHEKKPIESISANIIGTANLVNECIKKKVKIIYFSTNYVYPGLKGNYNEESYLYPVNNYAWSKLGGECAVKIYEKSLILRICMTEKPFVHKKAFKNMKTNFIFHEEVAKFLPKLFKYKGILNVGGPKQSVYNFAKKFNPKIKGINLKKNNHNLNMLNCSMNINKLKKILR